MYDVFHFDQKSQQKTFLNVFVISIKKFRFEVSFCFVFLSLEYKIDGLYFIDAANREATNFQRIHCNTRLSFNIYTEREAQREAERERESEMYMNTCADSGLGIIHYDYQTVMHETENKSYQRHGCDQTS